MASQFLCIFSVALCNVGNLDQSLFNQPQSQQQNLGNYNQATNIFNGFVNQASLGSINIQQGQRPQQRAPQSPCGKKFQYVNNGQGQWKGVIKIKNIDLSNDLLIEADFGLPQGRNQVG